MALDELDSHLKAEQGDGPWTRKHDLPGSPLIPAAPRIVYPTSLDQLIDICRTRDPNNHLKAAGSHWALSDAAISDHTFIETHDPNNEHTAMGRTLHEVIPACMHQDILEHMGFDQSPRGSLVHVEAGKRIYQLYAELDQPDDLTNPATFAGFMKHRYNNANYKGPWAFPTLGGAGGQTVVGALTTGTHGGDFRLAPIADAVRALHLVADGGKHYWIEGVDRNLVGPVTDDNKLRALYGTLSHGGPDNFEIIRDADNVIFNSVLLSAGRFGIIYSVVLGIVPQFSLHEQRRLTNWKTVKDDIHNFASPLYTVPEVPSAQSRFLQIVVCLTPHNNFTQNLAGVTKRWNVDLPISPGGRADRVGRILEEFNARIEGPLFEQAGRSHAYNPSLDPNKPNQSEPPTFLERACTDASFLVGVLGATIDEIDKFLNSSGVTIGTGIAQVAGLDGVGLLALARGLLLLLQLLKDLLDAFDNDDRLGHAVDTIRRSTLGQPDSDPVAKAAGVFVWQLFAFKVFEAVQGDLVPGFEAISYAVMDRHDYLDVSCNVNVDSIEVFFDATDDRLIAFVDALIAYETMQEFHGRACLGYASLRFVGPTKALIGMERHPISCAVEVAVLKDVSGSQELINYAASLALNPNIMGILHWGQRNESSMAQIEQRFGDSVKAPGGDLQLWRRALSRVTDNGRLDRFSSRFSRQTGLEVVEPKIGIFGVSRRTALKGEQVTINWDCRANPPETDIEILLSQPTAGAIVTQSLPLIGEHQFEVTETGTYSIGFFVTRTLNNVERQDTRSAFVTVA